MTQFNNKCQHLQNFVFYMFIFVKIWPVRTIVTHRQTDREMNKAMARSEIEDMPNNMREFYTAPERIDPQRRKSYKSKGDQIWEQTIRWQMFEAKLILTLFQLSAFTRRSPSLYAWPYSWPLQCAKVTCKYVNCKPCIGSDTEGPTQVVIQ